MTEYTSTPLVAARHALQTCSVWAVTWLIQYHPHSNEGFMQSLTLMIFFFLLLHLIDGVK